MIIIAGALGMLLSGVVIVLLLRTLLKVGISNADDIQSTDISWKDYRPLQRLLDPADFEFLRRRGVADQRIQKLYADRRRIYRLCLRTLARDFNQVHRSLSMVLIHSKIDRPELAAELATQRLKFFRNLIVAEVRLSLHGWGFKMPELDLLKPLEILQGQFSAFAAAGAAA